jgi:hypothetical protein
MMRQEDVGAWLIDEPGGTRDVTHAQRALEAIGMRLYKSHQPVNDRGFFWVTGFVLRQGLE